MSTGTSEAEFEINRLQECCKQYRNEIAILKSVDPIDLAIKFHNTYERLAPSFGYNTRLETRVFDSKSTNGRLMIAVCSEIFPNG